MPVAVGQTAPVDSPTTRPDGSLARLAPASVGLFVELRDPVDLLIPMTEPELWSTLAELAGQPARSIDTREWSARIRKTVDLDPADAIRTLFSRRVAFLGAGPRRSQDAVVICDPGEKQADAWLTRRNPSRLEDIAGPPTYHLYAGLSVAVHDRLLAFGDLVPESGLFRTYLSEVGRAQSARLSEDPAFRGLLARLPAERDGLLFARLRSVPNARAASQPFVDPLSRLLPASLRGSDNLMISLRRRERLLSFTAVGDARRPATLPHGPSKPVGRLLANVPSSALAAWSGSLDFKRLLEQIDQLPPSDPLRSIFNFSKSNDVPRRLAEALGSQVCVVVGSANPAGRPADAPPIPTAALMIELTDSQSAEESFRAIADSCVNLLNLLVLARGQAPIPDAEDRQANGRTYHFVELSRFVERIDHNAVAELHGAWAAADGVLVIASHEELLKEILAPRELDRSLAAQIRTLRDTESNASDILLVDSAAMSSLASRWLAFFQRTAPHAMDERWWRSRQPGGSSVRLGIDVDLRSTSAPQPESQPARVESLSSAPSAPLPRLIVRKVNPNLPAAGRLQVGDVLLGCDGRRFATTQPWVEMRERVEARPNPNYVDVQLERDGRVRVERLPIPFFDPMQALRRVESLGRLVSRFAYFDELDSPGGSRGVLTVELTGPTPAPATLPSPASQP